MSDLAIDIVVKLLFHAAKALRQQRLNRDGCAKLGDELQRLAKVLEAYKNVTVTPSIRAFLNGVKGAEQAVQKLLERLKAQGSVMGFVTAHLNARLLSEAFQALQQAYALGSVVAVAQGASMDRAMREARDAAQSAANAVQSILQSQQLLAEDVKELMNQQRSGFSRVEAGVSDILGRLQRDKAEKEAIQRELAATIERNQQDVKGYLVRFMELLEETRRPVEGAGDLLDALHCGICFQPFNHESRLPRICCSKGHTICTTCLRRIMASPAPVCPFDRSSLAFSGAERTIESLAVNRVVLQIIPAATSDVDRAEKVNQLARALQEQVEEARAARTRAADALEQSALDAKDGIRRLREQEELLSSKLQAVTLLHEELNAKTRNAAQADLLLSTAHREALQLEVRVRELEMIERAKKLEQQEAEQRRLAALKRVHSLENRLETPTSHGAARGTHLALLKHHQASISALSVAPDSSVFLSAAIDGTVSVIQLPDTTLIGSASTSDKHRGSVNDASMEPSGLPLACTGSTDASVRVWKWHSGSSGLALSAALTGQHKTGVRSCVLASARDLYSGDDAGLLVRWDLATSSSQSLSLGSAGIAHVRALFDKRFVAVSTKGGKVFLFDNQADRSALRAHAELQNGHAAAVTLLVPCHLSPDRFATAGLDATIRLWSTSSRSALVVLKGHAMCPASLAWLSESRAYGQPPSLVSVGMDGARAWDGSSGSLQDKLTVPGTMLKFVSAGRHLGSKTTIVLEAGGAQLLSWRFGEAAFTPLLASKEGKVDTTSPLTHMAAQAAFVVGARSDGSVSVWAV